MTGIHTMLLPEILQSGHMLDVTPLCMQLGGGITEKRQGRFGDAKSMPQITAALKKAAYDPRISGIVLKVSPLSAGWAKLQEIRQYIEFFR